MKEEEEKLMTEESNEYNKFLTDEMNPLNAGATSKSEEGGNMNGGESDSGFLEEDSRTNSEE